MILHALLLKKPWKRTRRILTAGACMAGFLFLSDGDPALVEESFDRAIEEWPQNFENHLFLAYYLSDCGDREEEAEASWERAAELAPEGLGPEKMGRSADAAHHSAPKRLAVRCGSWKGRVFADIFGDNLPLASKAPQGQSLSQSLF